MTFHQPSKLWLILVRFPNGLCFLSFFDLAQQTVCHLPLHFVHSLLVEVETGVSSSVLRGCLGFSIIGKAWAMSWGDGSVGTASDLIMISVLDTCLPLRPPSFLYSIQNSALVGLRTGDVLLKFLKISMGGLAMET